MRLQILVLLMGVILSGCSQQVLSEKTVMTYVVMDSTWLVPCPIIPPPNATAYASATLQQRTEMWSAVYLMQVKTQAGCNIRYDEASKYNALKQAETSTTACTAGVCK